MISFYQLQDHSIGIDPFEQERVLMPFFRSEQQSVRDEQGWGLNLAVAKKLEDRWALRWDLKACIVRAALSGFPCALLKLIAIGILSRREQPDHDEMCIWE